MVKAERGTHLYKCLDFGSTVEKEAERGWNRDAKSSAEY